MPKEPTGDPKSHPTSEFANGITGSCLCGSITVTINDNELFSKQRGHLCHCANCRKVAGSYVSSNLLIEVGKVEIKDKNGTKKTYEDRETLSGNPVYRSFCSEDGNPICSETSNYPGKIIMKLGMFPRIPQPEVEGFGLHKHPWEGGHDGVQVYEMKWAGPDKKPMA
ncbi:uncharacterized protein LTR77_003871 [Saxophila tyrrhenica]|uniref:CENP-V/GFA domain-containing protein n=1 Tax=Saxophila tyrrhenica TaxID=1690608 RepID=A0AAV9PF32_9PEZI|nr:hypothetical protein LTR77_003871 [Saxophila tyrrhenica]